jgi:hypothetical protein
LCPHSDGSSSSGCPKSCSKHAGEYVVEMKEFIEAYQTAKQQANEYACATQKSTCYYACQNGEYTYDSSNNYYNNYNNNNNGNNNNNNNNNYDACTYSCMSDAGMDYCAEGNDQQNNNNNNQMRDIGECRALDGGNGNNNNNNYYGGDTNYQTYYVGAYCTSSGVYVDTFTDSLCTKKAPSGTYETKTGGYSLPTYPLVTYDCISCKESNYNNNNNNNNQNNYYYDTVSDSCQQLYNQAGKCESNMKDSNMYYQDTSGCEMIHTTLSKLDKAFSSSMGRGPAASAVLAWLFAFAIVGMALYIYVLRRRLSRTGSGDASANLMGGAGDVTDQYAAQKVNNQGIWS